MSERQCGTILCGGKVTGQCEVAKLIQFQSEHGSNQPEGSNVWKRKTWENYIRNSSVALPNCVYPNQLQVALEIKPTFIEELNKDKV